MSASIYGIRYRYDICDENLKALTLRDDVATGPNTYSGERLFEILERDYRKTPPSKDLDSVLVWSDEYHELMDVTLPDGTPCWFYLLWDAAGLPTALLLER